MASHSNHHYVPEFLLKRWHDPRNLRHGHRQQPPGGCLIRYERTRDPTPFSKVSTAAMEARQRSLYSVHAADNSLERDYLGPKLDEPAAIALEQIIASPDIATLPQNHRDSWARFLVAQWIRTPEGMKEVESVAKQGITEARNRVEAARNRRDGPDARDEKDASRDAHTAAREELICILENRRWNRTFRDSMWHLHRFSTDASAVLIADHPLILNGSISGDFLVALPLSPRAIFLAWNNDNSGRDFFSIAPTRVSEWLNFETVHCAKRYVYASDRAEDALIAQHFRTGS
ncbi:DUF4238 domain-containing protein [Paraburkholderia xenovorans]